MHLLLILPKSQKIVCNLWLNDDRLAVRKGERLVFAHKLDGLLLFEDDEGVEGEFLHLLGVAEKKDVCNLQAEVIVRKPRILLGSDKVRSKQVRINFISYAFNIFWSFMAWCDEGILINGL